MGFAQSLEESSPRKITIYFCRGNPINLVSRLLQGGSQDPKMYDYDTCVYTQTLTGF